MELEFDYDVLDQTIFLRRYILLLLTALFLHLKKNKAYFFNWFNDFNLTELHMSKLIVFKRSWINMFNNCLSTDALQVLNLSMSLLTRKKFIDPYGQL